VLLSIAEMLGKSLQEVRMFPSSEITLWVAFMKIRNAPPEEKPKSDLDGFRNLVKA